eukprot:COSAG05_NODE_19155_length_297_cov_0.393939_1_plen_39_part_10
MCCTDNGQYDGTECCCEAAKTPFLPGYGTRIFFQAEDGI